MLQGVAHEIFVVSAVTESFVRNGISARAAESAAVYLKEQHGMSQETYISVQINQQSIVIGDLHLCNRHDHSHTQ